MRARYYNPEIRRFINQDVLIGSIDDSQSLNRFAYVNGEPVNSVDPFGLFSLKNSFNKIKTSFNTAKQAVKQVVNKTKKVVTQAAKQVKKVVSKAFKTITKPSTLKTIRNVAAVVGGVAEVAALVISAPISVPIGIVAGVSIGAFVLATGGLWVQDKQRSEVGTIVKYGGEIGITLVTPFAVAKLAGPAKTLIQLAKEGKGREAVVRIINAAVSLTTGTNAAVQMAMPNTNKTNK